MVLTHPTTSPPAGTRRPSRRPVATVDLVDVAHGLAGVALDWSGCVDPPVRQWRLLAASPDLEAWVIAWPAGGTIELHDHGGSAGAVLVLAGELVEAALTPSLSPAASGNDGTLSVRRLRAGQSIRFGGHHVHDVSNVGTRPAVSVHVYQPRLAAMTFYRLHHGRLEPDRTEQLEPGSVVP